MNKEKILGLYGISDVREIPPPLSLFKILLQIPRQGVDAISTVASTDN
jgi:hypothetical protein